MINLFEPLVGEEELSAVRDVFASRWLGDGEWVRQFEDSFGRHLDRPAAELVAVTSCTEGLFHVISALDLGPDDEVVLPAVSFIGAAHAVANSGAKVALADVEPLTLNPRLEQIEEAITPATRAILLMHYGGLPGYVADIAAFARQRNICLIEDAAVGLGSSMNGRPCGTLGDVGIWSFDAMKLLTTGDGGMIWSADERLIDRLRRSIKLGLGPSGFHQRHESPHWWEIDPAATGRRGAMNSIAAAIGLVQMTKLPLFLRRRREIGRTYDEALSALPWLTLQRWPPSAARTFYWIRVETGDIRERLANHLLDHDIYATYKYWPLHRTQLYTSTGEFPGADLAAETTLLLPMHQGLSDGDLQRVIDAIQCFEP